MRGLTMILLATALISVGCTSSPRSTDPVSARSQRSGEEQSPTSSSTSSPSEAPRPYGQGAVEELPNFGSLSWRCDTKHGPLDFRYSTTFTAEEPATETASYSLDGAASVSKVLQPGLALSTPFSSATAHKWRI